MLNKKNLLVALMLCATWMTAAAPLKNVPVVCVQPNGDTLHCLASGDEFFHRLHDSLDYTIVLNQETGEYVYAALSGGLLVPTRYVAGQTDPRNTELKPGLMPGKEEMQRRHKRWDVPEQYAYVGAKTSGANHGVLNNIVIFIRFSDDTTYATTSFSTINNKFNDSTAGASSMYNYFKKTSYNKLHVPTSFFPAQSGSTVVSYQDSHPRNYYRPYSVINTMGYVSDSDSRAREFSLLENAVAWINVNSPVPTSLNLDMDNDGLVDNVCFVVSGTYTGWSDLLWPHKWSLYDRLVYLNGKRVYTFNFQLAGSGEHYFGVSTLCHEMTHTLGCPDIYHYDNYVNVSPGGSWDLMNSNETPPQQTNSLFKFLYLNWFDSIPELIDSGTYTMQSLASGPNHAYKIHSSTRQQWYILEYRNYSDTFDSSIPGRGMLIWRYNESSSADNADFDYSSTPHQLWLFRPNSASDTMDGNVASAAFGVYGRNSFNSTSNPHPYLCDGTPDTSFSITNIQVSSDYSTVSFTFSPNGGAGCRGNASIPLVQNFEDGSEGCWTSVSMNTSNAERQCVMESTSSYPAYDGIYYYRFSSYYRATDYNQYYISPRIQSDNPLHLTFYYKKSHSDNEQFRVCYSTTTNTPESFTDTLGDYTVNSTGWHLCDLLVPAEARYIAINYYSSYMYYLHIDNISITDTLTSAPDTIVRDTTYIYVYDTMIRTIHDTIFQMGRDTCYYRITDSLTHTVWDTVYNALEYAELVVKSASPIAGKVSGNGVFPKGSSVEIAAIPSRGYYFQGWTDGNTENPRTVVVEGGHTYTANFGTTPVAKSLTPQKTLLVVHDTIYVTDTIWLTVHDTIVVSQRDTLWIPYPQHDTVWTELHEQLEIDTTTYYTLVVLSSMNEFGVAAGSGRFPEGTLVELGAVPNEGYELLYWSDGSSYNPKAIVLTGDMTMVATFALQGSQAVDSPDAETWKVYVENGDILVEAAGTDPISVYNSIGQMVYHKSGVSGGVGLVTTRISSLKQGFYAVRVGTAKVRKVMLF